MPLLNCATNSHLIGIQLRDSSMKQLEVDLSLPSGSRGADVAKDDRAILSCANY